MLGVGIAVALATAVATAVVVGNQTRGTALTSQLRAE
jgi:hypothetical protein